MADYRFGQEYGQGDLPPELFNVPSGELRNYNGIWYKVVNTGGGSRRLERPNATEITHAEGGLTPDEFVAKIKQEFFGMVDEMSKRVSDYDKGHPFTFDEMLAKASSEERYNPYYEAELNDFVAGIRAERQTVEGENKLLVELNQIKQGEEKRNLDEAVRASEEGYAGAGLYSSGIRERATGMEKIQGAETTAAREAQFGQATGANAIRLGDIATREATGRRRTEAEKTTAIQTDIANQKAEERARWEYEKAQYLGYPYVTSTTQGLTDLLGQAFKY